MGSHVRLFVVALLLALISIASVPALAAAPGPPQAPVGWQASGPPAGAWVHSERLTLPSAECASAQAVRFTDASCQYIHQWWSETHQPLPQGTRLAGASSSIALAAVPYYYWSWGDWDCSIYGCGYGGFRLWEDGVANDVNVWQWDVTCTPSGINTNCTWKGYFYNGGGYPYYAMQFGANEQQCLSTQLGLVCANHGMRRWINDEGDPNGFSAW
jgi:hypothetical protein